MKKAIAALFIIVSAALGALTFVAPAQAYPDNPPKNTTVVENENLSTGSPTAAPATLPNTGGPSESLLAGGAALVLVGGASVLVARRKQNA